MVSKLDRNNFQKFELKILNIKNKTGQIDYFDSLVSRNKHNRKNTSNKNNKIHKNNKSKNNHDIMDMITNTLFGHDEQLAFRAIQLTANKAVCQKLNQKY